MGAPAKLVSVLVFLSTLAFAVHAGTRFSREVTEDDINDELEKAQGEIDGFFKKIWGAPCANENQGLGRLTSPTATSPREWPRSSQAAWCRLTASVAPPSGSGSCWRR